MYKIYINEKPLILKESGKESKGVKTDKKTLVTPYLGKPKFFLPYIDMLSKNTKVEKVIIHHHDVKALKRDFFSLVQRIKAGGGLVLNEKDEILVIFRRGFWDLPKGKMEPGETKRKSALREVMEETGIKDVRIEKKLLKTYHLFNNKRGRAIKESHWYLMRTSDKKLVPQHEEDIEIAQWISAEKFLNECKPMFKNIKEVVRQIM